jgi:hypothetical protein
LSSIPFLQQVDATSMDCFQAAAAAIAFPHLSWTSSDQLTASADRRKVNKQAGFRFEKAGETQ